MIMALYKYCIFLLLKVVKYGCSICRGMMLVRDVGIITVLLKCSMQN